jgi:hypothetical protein
MDPTSKLLVVVDVGSRTLAMAQRVVHQVTRVLAPDCVPLLFTDGLKEYPTALLTHFGRCKKSSCIGCRRGHSHRQSKNRHGLRSVVLRGSVYSDAGQEAWTGLENWFRVMLTG